MTITNRAMNERLNNLERCAEKAPEGAYGEAKEVSEVIHDISNSALTIMRAAGFEAGNDDRLRNLEVAIYTYFLQSNHEPSNITAAEGFGENVDGPAGERVLMQAIRDRDFLANLRA